ncbi:MAG: response regulator transcription factor [Comamonadaceae bacterium]|nr:MAG: response regulator transcription factor [Comamonadaceae bacterium]
MLSRNEAQKMESNLPTLSGLTVLIADDQHLVRGGLKLCLTAIGQDVTVLEAETVQSAIDTYRASPGIGLVLLDPQTPGSQGMTALDEFSRSCPEARIVIVSSAYDLRTVQTALAKGVRGLIPKSAGRTVFINALRFVLDGGVYIPPETFLTGSAASAPAPAPYAAQRNSMPQAAPSFDSAAARTAALRNAKLTSRQIDVLAQLLDGKANKQICRELNLAMGTVKCHVGAILGALEVNSRAEAIAAANKRGWQQWVAPVRTQESRLV